MYLGKLPSIVGSLRAFGPLLFLIYVNDLATVFKDILPILFAEDTNLVMSNTNFDCLMSKADRGLKDLHFLFIRPDIGEIFCHNVLRIISY